MRSSCKVVSVLCCLAMPAVLCAHDNPGEVHQSDRFTPNVDGATFPPQPRQIENVRQFRPFSIEASAQRAFDPGVSVVNPEVTASLGDRYALINSSPVRRKGEATQNLVRSLYFSHSNNQTVTVFTRGSAVEDIVIEAASVNQPALATSEMDDAIALARAYWRQQGKLTVDTLQGYAIQTFQPNGNPYDTRMVYVSFHTVSPEPPLLYNRVDLTRRTVVDGEEE